MYPAIQLYNDSHVGGGLHLATSAGLKQKVLNASNQPDSANAVLSNEANRANMLSENDTLDRLRHHLGPIPDRMLP